MRIVLLYPPPWKIPLPNEPLDPKEGPPKNIQPGDLDWDFFQTPYGLFSLAAQCLRAGHEVKVLNLSGFAWKHVEHVLNTLQADLWGMSCWTANRRGVALVARELKKRNPNVPIIVGGPHASPLAKEMLAHYPAIDAVCEGESEQTFLEILARVEEKRSFRGLAGAWYRDNGTIVQGPERSNMRDMDTLAPPHQHFPTHILMTSRGCPWQCTFCGAETTWGRGFRSNSVDYVLDELAMALPQLPVRMIMVKDDTFTTNKKRVIELCRGIRKRNLRFVWSCDTRVDVLNEELLYEMRLAGCQRMSLGVESGSQKILNNIDKKITVDEILRSTELIKKYGIVVRYYMMLGNRGENAETLRETEAFIERAQPHQYVVSLLSVFPGTRDFYDAEAAGWMDREAFFTGDFQEYQVSFDATEQDTALFNRWHDERKGLQILHQNTTEEYRSILHRLPEHHAAHVELGGSLWKDGKLEDAAFHVKKGLELGYPLPGVAHNYLACIAHDRGDYETFFQELQRGIEEDPQHPCLLKNYDKARVWLEQGGPQKKLPLELEASHEFELLERAIQPTMPGPLAKDFAEWKGPMPVTPVPPVRPKDPEALSEKRRLRVMA